MKGIHSCFWVRPPGRERRRCSCAQRQNCAQAESTAGCCSSRVTPKGGPIKNLPHCVRSVSPRAPMGTLAYLADTTGELRTLTQVADLAFIGKSLPPNDGGQTPIDCAALGVPMVYGPNMTNFRRICATLEESAAAVKVPDADGAVAEIARLAKNPDLRATLAVAARRWHSSNIGAAKRDFDAVCKFL